MLSRPNYCCSCGEKVERIEWHVWTSRRYCELCQTEHQLDEWAPKAAIAAALLVGLGGLGGMVSQDDVQRELISEPVRLARERSDRLARKEQAPVVMPERDAASHPEPNASREAVVERPMEQPQAAEEPVSFCGALTKKGTSCTRKVKGGGRCWQHKGTAALPQATPYGTPAPAREPDETS